jgi:acid stress-induced BolA-like protein IbaG/YrbA
MCACSCAVRRARADAAPSCSIDVVAAAFEGKSAVDRQRMVYKAIWMELQARATRFARRSLACAHLPTWLRPLAADGLALTQEAVHAVDAMTTRTPAEAGR